MKKLVALMLTVVIAISICACGSSTSSETTTVESTEAVSETIIDKETTIATTEAETEPATVEPSTTKKLQTLTIEEFDNILSSLPLTIDETNYIVQDEKYKSLYPDMLQAIITNHTDSDIKDAVISFVAWDSNKLPVKIKGNIDFSDGSYIKEVSFADINLVPGSSFGDSSGYSIEENNSIDTFEAVVKSFETFEGDTWNNPYYKAWCKLYEGVKYSDTLSVEVELADNVDFSASSEKNSTDSIDVESLLSEIEAQDFKVVSTNYLVQNSKYKSLYPDMLQAILQNDTDLDIKNAIVAFVAWDENDLPTKIAGQYSFGDAKYIEEVKFEDINMVPGSTFGEKNGFALDENNNIAEFKAIVVSYEAFDGTQWKNPCYKDWCKLYEGVKMKSEE